MPGLGRRFRRKQSGNPGGRPKVLGEVREPARVHTAAAIQTLVSIMCNEPPPASARISFKTPYRSVPRSYRTQRSAARTRRCFRA
jgi:hypothetical protein